MSAASEAEQTFGRYQLIELLGRGGMAEVWRARMAGPAGVMRTVVIKRIRPLLAQEAGFSALFEREARLSAHLTHANIVQVYEFGTQADEPYLVMEFVPGRDLAKVINAIIEGGALPPVGLGVYVVREVARALAYAHALKGEDGRPLGLVHRDISPSNVILGFDGSVKLLDFGIAKSVGDVDLTQTGVFKGKAGYTAPEVVQGEPHDARSDLFALGVVLYEALTGTRLFRGTSDLHTFSLVREQVLEPPSRVNPAVPPALDAIVMKALARSPAQRYQTADGLAHDLDPVLHELKFGALQASGLVSSVGGLTTPPPLPEPRVSAPAARPETAVSTADLLLPPPTPSASPPPQPAPPARPWWLWLTAAFAVGLGAALIAMQAGWRGAPGPVENRPAEVVVAPAPVPPVAPPAPPVDAPPPPSARELTVVIKSDPKGAEVRTDENRLLPGLTPMTVTFASDARPRKLWVKKKGYEKYVITLTDAEQQEYTARLVLPP